MGRFNLQHALSCKTGQFISISHKLMKIISASLLRKICKDVTIKSTLQQTYWLKMKYKISKHNKNEARLDVRVRGFWNAK